MSWNNTGIKKAFKASAAISPYRIVKFASDDFTVTQASAATDLLVGVCNELGITATEISGVSPIIAADPNRTIDIVLTDVAEVEFGGTVTRGQPVTADANGKGVLAAPATGANVRIIGFAMKSAVAGDIAPVLLAPAYMQG